MIPRLFAQQQKGQQLGAELIKLLRSGDYRRLTVVVAFLRSEGVDQLEEALRNFLSSGGTSLFVVGISGRVTSYEGLKLLLDVVQSGSVAVFYNSNSSAGIFHPKLYFFEGEKKVAVVIASNNFTKPGLFSNYELATIIELNPQSKEDQRLQSEVSDYVQELLANGEVAKNLTAEFLEALKENGAVQIEEKEPKSDEEAEEEAAAKLERSARQAKIKGLFGSAPVTSAPPSKKKTQPKTPAAKPAVATPQPTAAGGRKLIMRPYPQRNGTQIQVPVLANNVFFSGSGDVTSQHDNVPHRIRVARARGKTNTLKLEIPECRTLQIPILVFQKTHQGTVYRALEGKSGEGARLLKQLEQGLRNGSTSQTYPRSTMWRVE